MYLTSEPSGRLQLVTSLMIPRAHSTDPRIHPATGERLIPFHLTLEDHILTLKPVGLLTPAVLTAILTYAAGGPDRREWAFRPFAERPFAATPVGSVIGKVDGVQCLTFHPEVVASGSEAMSNVMREMTTAWRVEGLFGLSPVPCWEDCQVHADPLSSFFSDHPSKQRKDNVAFCMPRQPTSLFGVSILGAHLIAYEGEGVDMKIWIQRRGASLHNYPLAMDSTAGGGISAGMGVRETLLAEASEEAGLDPFYLDSRLRCCGALSFMADVRGVAVVFETDYTFEVKLDPTEADYQHPRVVDKEEVDSFSLIALPELLTRLRNREICPGATKIIIDFLIRHGIITPENEPDYLQLLWASKVELPVAMGTRLL